MYLRALLLSLLLHPGCERAEAVPPPGTCTDADVAKTLEFVPKAASDVRINLLTSALIGPCGEALDEGLRLWLRRWAWGDEQPDSVPLTPDEHAAIDVRRKNACKKGDDLWASDFHLHVAWPSQMSLAGKRCKLNKLGLLDGDSVIDSAGPEAALLGSLVYSALVDAGRSPEAASTIGHWIAGSAVESRVSRGVYGEIAADVQGVELPTTTASKPLRRTGCLLSIRAGTLEIDGATVTAEGISEGFSECDDRSLFVAADGGASYNDVRKALGAGSRFGSLKLVGVGSKAQVETDPLYTIDATLPMARPEPQPEPKPEPKPEPDPKAEEVKPAPKSKVRSKAGMSRSKSNHTELKLGLIGARAKKPARLRLEVVGTQVRLLAADQVRETVVLGDLEALGNAVYALKADHPSEFSITVAAAADVSWAEVVSVLDVSRQDGDNDIFPYAVLGDVIADEP